MPAPTLSGGEYPTPFRTINAGKPKPLLPAVRKVFAETVFVALVVVAPEFGETLQQAEPLEAVDMDSHVASPPSNFFSASVVRNTLAFCEIGRGKCSEETVHEVKRFIAIGFPFQVISGALAMRRSLPHRPIVATFQGGIRA
jgi:hypothetical protein